MLRDTLDQYNLTDVGIIAADGDWQIATVMAKDPYLNDAVEVIG